MSDLLKEIANTVVRIKSEMRKASFASRSEAGRYAANMRWKGQGTVARYSDLTSDQEKQVQDAEAAHYQSTNQRSSTEDFYANHAAEFGFKADAKQVLGGVDRGRDILDNETNDNGDSIADLNSRYQNDDEAIPFEDLPSGGFREQVIRDFIDFEHTNYWDESSRLSGPYDRYSYEMTPKGYAKARAHALKGSMDGRGNALEDYWDNNSSVHWDEFNETLEANKTGEYE
tara:strand:+ start:2567 stop:3253 length:687 start_codon:yes stop_codon:yes gene_type:complete